MVAADEHAIAHEADVPVRVPGQLDDRPAVELAAFVKELGVARKAYERSERMSLLDQLVRDRRGNAVRHEPVGDPFRPVVRAPDALALRIVERALGDGRARLGGRTLGAADVVGVEVRDRNPLDAELAPGRRLDPEACVEERAADEVAVDVARAGGERERESADARGDFGDGYFETG